MSHSLNWNSGRLTGGWQQGVNAFYYGLGFSDQDLERAQVGIGTPLLEGNLCNLHAHELARKVAEGCQQAGLVGFPFGTPGVSDNISQGHEGGNGSLPSRNLIANSAECVVTAHGYDALVGLHHCDKNGPGFAMALARTNYPGLIVSGGYDQGRGQPDIAHGMSRARRVRDSGFLQYLGHCHGSHRPDAAVQQLDSRGHS